MYPSSGQKTLSAFETGTGKEDEDEDFSSCSLDATFSATLLLECQTEGIFFRARWSFFGFARSFSTSPTGSPVEAFSTSPPSSIAISVSSRFETTDRGRVSAMSSSEAKSSRCLMRSHVGLEALPQPFVRTSTHEPPNFVPERVNFSSPFFKAASTSGVSGDHVPLSQIMTVPPPYSPAGMIPSKLAYSIGWSSTCVAKRFTDGSSDGPFGTAQDNRTPFHSRRKS